MKFIKIIFYCCVWIFVTIPVAFSQTKSEFILVDTCISGNVLLNKKEANENSVFCIIDNRFGAKENILALEESDKFATISKSAPIKRNDQSNLLIVDLAFEPDEKYATHKIIVLSIRDRTKIVPLLITSSWGASHLVDVNNDGILDIELYKNPQGIETSNLHKWPVVIDGSSVSSEFRYSEIPTYIKSVIEKMEAQIDIVKEECKLIKEDKEYGGICAEHNDIIRLELQVKELKHQVEK